MLLFDVNVIDLAYADVALSDGKSKNGRCENVVLVTCMMT